MELKNSDGIQATFYYFLWSKSKYSQAMKFRIPNTVIFEDGVPTAWFFTGKKGSILKKGPSNTSIPAIKKYFGKQRRLNNTNIAAVYVYNSNKGFKAHQNEKGEEVNYLKDVLESKGYIIHYFTYKDLGR